MKVLNLYAGIGGNRKLWDNVEVTAVEIDPQIAEIYQDFFPDDKIEVTDAHQYLLDHFKNFDFIWSSPPCPTHSQANNFLFPQGVIRYPDMKLYEEIIFLSRYSKKPFCVENVVSYYDPLIKPYKIGRHYFWANFYITSLKTPEGPTVTNARQSTRRPRDEHLRQLQEYHGFDCDNRTLLANCVYPPIGKHILDCARGNTVKLLTEYTEAVIHE